MREFQFFAPKYIYHLLQFSMLFEVLVHRALLSLFLILYFRSCFLSLQLSQPQHRHYTGSCFGGQIVSQWKHLGVPVCQAR